MIALLNGAPQLVVKLLYGSGLRLMEALRLRVRVKRFAPRGLTFKIQCPTSNVEGRGSRRTETFNIQHSMSNPPSHRSYEGQASKVERRNRRDACATFLNSAREDQPSPRYGATGTRPAVGNLEH